VICNFSILFQKKAYCCLYVYWIVFFFFPFSSREECVYQLYKNVWYGTKRVDSPRGFTVIRYSRQFNRVEIWFYCELIKLFLSPFFFSSYFRPKMTMQMMHCQIIIYPFVLLHMWWWLSVEWLRDESPVSICKCWANGMRGLICFLHCLIGLMWQSWWSAIPNVELEFSKPLYENDQFKWGTVCKYSLIYFRLSNQNWGLDCGFFKSIFYFKIYYNTIVFYFLKIIFDISVLKYLKILKKY